MVLAVVVGAHGTPIEKEFPVSIRIEDIVHDEAGRDAPQLAIVDRTGRGRGIVSTAATLRDAGVSEGDTLRLIDCSHIHDRYRQENMLSLDAGAAGLPNDYSVPEEISDDAHVRRVMEELAKCQRLHHLVLLAHLRWHEDPHIKRLASFVTTTGDFREVILPISGNLSSAQRNALLALWSIDVSGELTRIFGDGRHTRDFLDHVAFPIDRRPEYRFWQAIGERIEGGLHPREFMSLAVLLKRHSPEEDHLRAFPDALLTLQEMAEAGGPIDSLAAAFPPSKAGASLLLTAVGFDAVDVPDRGEPARSFWLSACTLISVGTCPYLFEPLLAEAHRRMPGNRSFLRFQQPSASEFRSQLLATAARCFCSSVITDRILTDDLRMPLDRRPPFPSPAIYWCEVCEAVDAGAWSGNRSDLLAKARSFLV